MGHASITTTLDLYGHLYPGEMDRYADRLGSAAEDAAEDIGKVKIRPEEDEDEDGAELLALLPGNSVARSEGLEPPTF